LRKGSLGLAVMAALWPGRLYGLELLRRLESEAGLTIPEGTIYPLLNRLKANGLVSSTWVDAETGHPRKYYELTEAGRGQAREMARAWTGFVAGVGRLLEPIKRGPDQ
jgi:PadR family transcriptional regulator PadR